MLIVLREICSTEVCQGLGMERNGQKRPPTVVHQNLCILCLGVLIIAQQAVQPSLFRRDCPDFSFKSPILTNMQFL